jgi:GNAT superfamily N-acetyltransferase
VNPITSKLMATPVHPAFRPATVRDAAVIARHRVAMFTEMGHVPTAALAGELLSASTRALESLLQEHAYAGYLAVEPGGRIIAGAGVHIRPQLPRVSGAGTSVTTGPIPLLVNVYTEPEWRRRGIARGLVLALMRWTTGHDFDHLDLHASADGRHLYESLGFAATNEMRWFPRSSAEEPC